jgi:hypothetical protein
MSARTVIQTASLPFFSTLLIAPRYEQIRRISSNFVRPFIEHSPLGGLMANAKIANSVLQRNFANGSTMYFSFAFIDAERTRGIPADCVTYDEIQDLDADFMPIIQECMSASDYGMEMFFGTPKTMENTIEVMWEESSQGEWVIKCDACGHWNIPSQHHDLYKMIGKIGPSCARCTRLVNPREGHFRHAFPQNRWILEGHHVPQISMPMHYEDPKRPGEKPTEASEKWVQLLRKYEGKDGYTQGKFANEVLGESCDHGSKLVSMTDLKKAAVLNPSTFEAACEAVSKYSVRIMGVDWGGGGQDETSTTTVAAVGWNPRENRAECFYAERFSRAMSHDQEAAKVLKLFTAFQCQRLAHDFNGAGGPRETIMLHAGFPYERIFPLVYMPAHARGLVRRMPPKPQVRAHYGLHKSMSLVVTATAIKQGLLLLPKYESAKEVLDDWLALYEELREKISGGTAYLILRNPKLSDDFAHSLNMATCCLWFTNKCFPALSSIAASELSEEDLKFASPSNPDWDLPV